jgi:hypothetical protein
MRGFRLPNQTAEPETKVAQVTAYRRQEMFRADRIRHTSFWRRTGDEMDEKDRKIAHFRMVARN